MLIFPNFQIKALPQASSIVITAHLQLLESKLARITLSTLISWSKGEKHLLKENQI
jgi:hypothetical protein